MAIPQTEEATDNKPESMESGTVRENGSEKTDSKGPGIAQESRLIELSTESFKAFCSDISAMFGIGIECNNQETATVTIEILQERFKDLAAVTGVKAEGALEGTFQIILSREGLFTLAGAIVRPTQKTSLLEKCTGPEKTMKNIESGSLKEAEEVSDTVAEACNLLIGSCDRVFREGLEGHKHLLQTGTFVGDPWDNSIETTGLSGDEEYLFASYKITISSYPAFDCGVIFPKTIFAKVNPEIVEKAKAEAEEKDKAEAEQKAKTEAEAEEKAKAEAEEKAKAEAEEKTKAEAEEKAKAEAEAKAKAEAEEKVKAEAEEKAKAEAEEKAKAEAEEKAKAEAEEKAKAEAEEKAKAEAEAKAKAEAEEKAKAEAEEKAKAEAEEKAKAEAEEKAKAEAEEKAKAEAEEKVKTEAKPEATDQPKAEAEAKAEVAEEKDKPKAEVKGEAEAKPQTEEKTSAPAQGQEPQKGKVSETIQKMTQSPAILPGESGKAAVADICVSSEVCATDIMQKEVVWATPEENVQQALTKMQQRDSGYIMIGKDGVLEGIVSKSDISGATSIYLRPIFAKWYGPLDDATLQIKLKWIMSRPVRTIRPETPLATIIENICRFGGRGLPVVDEEGKVQGLVTVFDIFRTLLNTSDNVSTVGKTAEVPALVEH